MNLLFPSLFRFPFLSLRLVDRNYRVQGGRADVGISSTASALTTSTSLRFYSTLLRPSPFLSDFLLHPSLLIPFRFPLLPLSNPPLYLYPPGLTHASPLATPATFSG